MINLSVHTEEIGDEELLVFFELLGADAIGKVPTVVLFDA